jgi:hypothetical protein
MKTLPRIAAAAAVALALAACGQKSKPDPYVQNLPEVAAVTMDTSAGAPAGVVGAAVVDPLPVTTAGDDLGLVHEKARRMNEALRDAFAHLEALIASGGHELPGSVKEWGPAVRCVQPDGAGGCAVGGEAKLVLRARLWNDHLADFVVAATSTAGTTYKPVLAGFLVRGARDRRGAGKLWVNHENLLEAAPGFLGRGYLAAGFAAGPVAKEVTYRMLGFTRDASDPVGHPAVTATFTAWKNAAGWVRARVAGIGQTDGQYDLYHPAGQPSLAELGVWRAVWAPGNGGRAFTVIAGGDVAAGKYWFARACYAPGAATPSYKEWFECDKTADGSPVACVLNAPLVAGSHQGAVDPSVPTALAHWSETTCYWNPAQHAGALEPDELAAPTLAPRDENDDRDEDGAAHVGLLPEACPTTATSVMNPDPTPPGMMGSGGMM